MAEHIVILDLLSTSEVLHRARSVRLSRWGVVLDGTKVGMVERRMVTRERRKPGRRYVENRWKSPGWTYSSDTRFYVTGTECYSRTDGVERVLKAAGVNWQQAQNLAKTTSKVRAR